jgi:hypothetical protein
MLIWDQVNRLFVLRTSSSSLPFPSETQKRKISSEGDTVFFIETLGAPQKSFIFLELLHRQFQGCQIFLGTKYQNGEKYTKLPINYTQCP